MSFHEPWVHAAIAIAVFVIGFILDLLPRALRGAGTHGGWVGSWSYRLAVLGLLPALGLLILTLGFLAR